MSYCRTPENNRRPKTKEVSWPIRNTQCFIFQHFQGLGLPKLWLYYIPGLNGERSTSCRVDQLLPKDDSEVSTDLL